MSCPFPGMDPYLEMPPNWGDFTPQFLTAISNSLLGQVFPEYDVRIEEYLLVMVDEEPLGRVQPDATISKAPSWNPSSASGEASAAATAVVEIDSVALDYPSLEPETQRHLKIIRRKDQRVVTVIELLSPSNKQPGEKGFEAYLAKRNELIQTDVNLVELDLLRGGKRLPMRGELPPGDYYALIGRASERPHCQVIHWPVQAKLPAIPVPLAPEDEETRLDLGAAFRKAYEPALFHRRLPYHEALLPPPDGALRRWIDECLAKRPQ